MYIKNCISLTCYWTCSPFPILTFNDLGEVTKTRWTSSSERLYQCCICYTCTNTKFRKLRVTCKCQKAIVSVVSILYHFRDHKCIVHHDTALITSANEVMFSNTCVYLSVLSVCLSVNRITQNNWPLQKLAKCWQDRVWRQMKHGVEVFCPVQYVGLTDVACSTVSHYAQPAALSRTMHSLQHRLTLCTACSTVSHYAQPAAPSHTMHSLQLCLTLCTACSTVSHYAQPVDHLLSSGCHRKTSRLSFLPEAAWGSCATFSHQVFFS